MKYIQLKKVMAIVILIIKDGIKLLILCLIATILASICMEQGWILLNETIDISYDMFWKLYSLVAESVPFIMFYRGIKGRYKIDSQDQNKESYWKMQRWFI